MQASTAPPARTEFDVVIAGAGVNGLACAAVLAQAGLSVCVLERNPWVGGGAVTREVTLPGFKHDLFGSSHVWIQCNADFKAIAPELERYGLEYLAPTDQITGHPDKSGGPGIVIYRSIDKTCQSIARYSLADADRYRKVHDDFALVRAFSRRSSRPPRHPPRSPARSKRATQACVACRSSHSLPARGWR
jgi:phytoene dehydrogenase-like protein